MNNYEIGSYVTFGKYMQSSDELEPIEWLILDKKDDELLVITKHVIEYMQFCKYCDRSPFWDKSDIRQWLNDDFIKIAFSEEEQSQLVEKLVDNTEYAFPKRERGEDTLDKVFLLSVFEAQQYFGDDRMRLSCPTEHNYKLVKQKFEDCMKRLSRPTEHVKKKGMPKPAPWEHSDWCDWICRTIADFRGCISYVSDGGGIHLQTWGNYLDKNHGIRPAMWIKIAQ